MYIICTTCTAILNWSLIYIHWAARIVVLLPKLTSINLCITLLYQSMSYVPSKLRIHIQYMYMYIIHIPLIASTNKNSSIELKYYLYVSFTGRQWYWLFAPTTLKWWRNCSRSEWWTQSSRTTQTNQLWTMLKSYTWKSEYCSNCVVTTLVQCM